MSQTTRPRRHDIDWFIEQIREREPFFRLECFCDERKLFESNNEILTISHEIHDPEISGVLGSIDRSGARLPYRCELYPSALSQLSETQTRLGVMYSDIDHSYRGVPPFPDWFSSWVDGRIIVPDTGIILNHYLSEVLLPRTHPRQIRIRIPRLVILEIEAKGNRSLKEKRLSLSAFEEIRKLRLEANAFPFSNPLDINLMSSFSQISGRRRVDEFIRREIWDKLHRFSMPPERAEQIVLMTRDMMMASAASVEDIDAFYFCPAEPEKTEFSIDSTILAKIIIETAVTFGEIRLEGLSDNHSIICEGMWSGKNLLDWYKKRLRVRFKEHRIKENIASSA